jgi:adenine-specific DNA-methyltransferase
VVAPREADLIKEVDRLKLALKKQEYGLVWLNVPEAFEEEHVNQVPILKEIPELNLRNGKQRTHLLIEGDNYHALTCLNFSHRQGVDLIYIDPPYNTGSDGFRYKDKRVLDKFPDGSDVPKDHPLRHSYWLSFMAKRLELAKNLLKRDGAILISINEEEFAQLKLLCDKIFGAKNYLTMFTIKVRHEERILKGDKDFHEVVEYLLMYRASAEYKVIKKIYDNTSLADYVFQIVEKNSSPEIVKMGNKDVAIFKPSEFEIVKREPSADNMKSINIRGTLKEGNSSGRFYMKHLEQRKNRGYLYRVPDMGSDKFGHRYFLTPEKKSRVNGDYFQGVPLDIQDTKEVPYPNYFDFEKAFNSVGSEGGVNFGGGKKPISFLKHFIKLATNNPNAVIMDFFGGSGSTAHAVMELNHEDSGDRQFILVTNNEEWVKKGKELIKIEIMREICLPRIRNVVAEIPNNVNFYRTEFIGTENVLNIQDDGKLELAKAASDLLAIAEETLEFETVTDSYAFYRDNLGLRYTGIYFVEDLKELENFIAELKNHKGSGALYVFSWGTEVNIDELQILDGVTIKPIPEPILQAYRQIFDGVGVT